MLLVRHGVCQGFVSFQGEASRARFYPQPPAASIRLPGSPMLQLQIRQQIERRREVGRGPFGVGAVEGKVDRFLEEDGAEELEALVEGGRAGLLRVQLQVEV